MAAETLPPACAAPPTLADASALLNVLPLQEVLRHFAAARDWTRFHAPKNLAMALTGEVGELVELFQWLDAGESHDVARQPATARAVRDELADVLIYLVRLADVLGVDLDEAVRTKLASNAVRYPPLPAPADDAGAAAAEMAGATGIDRAAATLASAAPPSEADRAQDA